MQEEFEYEVVVMTDEETGEEVEFAIIEETKINGVNYFLATEAVDDDSEEAEAYIFKDVSVDEDGDAVLELVTDESEIEYIGKVFEQMLDDFDIIPE
ncbi:MAG: DUF1292 domain-containing protein [Lachnospiraceae bacterium]|nr:DUF1292 domain-containing protein [Lachnospiraceae bacterium]